MGSIIKLIGRTRIEDLKANKRFQIFFVCMSMFMLSIYFLGYLLTLSEVVYVLETNTKLFDATSSDVKEVLEYEIDNNGIGTITLMDGTVVDLISSEDYHITFAKNIDEETTYWIGNENLLLKGVASDYGTNMIKSNYLYLVLLYCVMYCLFLSIGREFDMSIMGKKSIAIVSFLLVTGIVFLAIFTFTYF